MVQGCPYVLTPPVKNIFPETDDPISMGSCVVAIRNNADDVMCWVMYRILIFGKRYPGTTAVSALNGNKVKVISRGRIAADRKREALPPFTQSINLHFEFWLLWIDGED